MCLETAKFFLSMYQTDLKGSGYRSLSIPQTKTPPLGRISHSDRRFDVKDIDDQKIARLRTLDGHGAVLWDVVLLRSSAFTSSTVSSSRS